MKKPSRESLMMLNEMIELHREQMFEAAAAGRVHPAKITRVFAGPDGLDARYDAEAIGNSRMSVSKVPPSNRPHIAEFEFPPVSVGEHCLIMEDEHCGLKLLVWEKGRLKGGSQEG